MADIEHIKLELPSSSRFIVIARRAVDSIGMRLGLTEEEIDDLKLAVGEACSNAVKFAFPDSKSFSVLFSISPTKLEIEVCNKGNAFKWDKPEHILEPVSEIQEDGMGLSLIEELMDEMHIDSAFGETTIRMVKNL